MILSGKKHLCKAGETFDIVALEEYGDEKYACELLGGNPTLCNVTVFSGGEVLELPIVVVPENEGDIEYTPAKAPWKE